MPRPGIEPGPTAWQARTLALHHVSGLLLYSLTHLILFFLVLKDILMQEEFAVFQERDVVLTLDDIKFLTSGTKTTEDQMDLVVTKLLELQVKIFMLRAEEGVKVRILE